MYSLIYIYIPVLIANLNIYLIHHHNIKRNRKINRKKYPTWYTMIIIINSIISI